MKGLKSKGLEEVEAVQKRIIKLYGLGRLDDKEFETLNEKVMELKNAMKEVIE
jgi:hypothetical protein